MPKVLAVKYVQTPPKPLAQVIVETAYLYEINPRQFLGVAKCESRLRNVQSEVITNGVREESYGIFQIHLPDHPSVTRELALNPSWAIEWSAEKFKADPTIWVCYNKLYGQ